jgi:hypothetical protein
MAKKTKTPKLVILEVTLKQTYAFREGQINGWPVDTVINDWFKNHALFEHHATRDACKIGNSEKLVSIKRVE